MRSFRLSRIILATALVHCSASRESGGGATADAHPSHDDALGSADSAPVTDATVDATVDATFPGDSTIDAAPIDDGAVLEIGGFDVTPIDAATTTTLQITPADNVVTLSGGAPQTVAYFTSIVHPDGTTTDVTASTTFTIDDPTLGTFSGATFTATKAGTSIVHATVAGLANTAKLEVANPPTMSVDGAPGDAGTKFGGSVDASRAPTIVYPADGVLVPPNLNVFEFHFLPGAGNTLFELAFLGDGVDTKVYFTCTAVGAGCVYTPDATVWRLVAEGGRGRAAITYTLRGVDGTSPSSVGSAASQTIRFGEEDMTGGIYYWNAGLGAVIRYEFGVSGKTGETFLNAAKAGAGVCVGCHTLSRDGSTISVGLDIPSPSATKVLNVATLATLFTRGGGAPTVPGGAANFVTFSPNGAQILGSNGITTSLWNGTTGASIAEPLLTNGSQADWSPVADVAVFAQPKSSAPCFPGICGSTGVAQASLMTMAETGTTWSTPAVLVPYAGQNNYYPTYSPDGAWVMFNRSPSDHDSYDAPDARVWIVSAAGGAPIELTTASSTNGDSWPKWTPAVQQYQGKKLLWATVSSRRAYGLRLAAGKTAQLWMTAIDPDKATAGADPSYPGFWLPFQDSASGNHIAQWVTRVVRTKCGGAGDCDPGMECIRGVCRPPVIH